MRRLGPDFVLAATSCLLVAGGALADSLEGKTAFLCSAVEVTICTADGICESEVPWNLNIPQFLHVDLAGKRLATTQASGENRSSPIEHSKRENGQIFIQGIEGGRAFSMVLRERDGLASIAIAADGLTIAVFGACTPESQR